MLPLTTPLNCDNQGMDEVAEVDIGEWIKPRLTGPRGTVTFTSPAGYSDYIRIFHPAMSDPDDQFYTWTHVAALTQRTVHPEAQWLQIAGADDSGRWPHLSPALGRLEHALK